jgi:hypothetical protein
MAPRRTLWLVPVLGLAALARAASGADQAANTTSGPDVSIDVDVIAKKLAEARQRIQPSLGSTSYNFSADALQTIPPGENAPLNQVLLQAPGVAQDSLGQIHLRGEGEHAKVQYRLDGVKLPEGLSVFDQATESRFANSMTLIAGSRSSQYGFQTAGVVDIQTETGTTNPDRQVTIGGGSFDWPSGRPSNDVHQTVQAMIRINDSAHEGPLS